MSPKSEGSSSTLAELSSQLAAAVETAGNSVVAIQARRRIPSSGIVWRDGVVVSASHTVRRDDEIPIVLPNGESTVATVAGRDPATDLIASDGAVRGLCIAFAQGEARLGAGSFDEQLDGRVFDESFD